MIFHCLHTEALACAAESSTKLTAEKEVSGAITKCIPSNEIQSPWEQLFYRCGRGEAKAILISSPWEVQVSNSPTSPFSAVSEHIRTYCAGNEHRASWGLKGQEDPGYVPLPANQNPPSPHSHWQVSTCCSFCRCCLSRGRPCSGKVLPQHTEQK